ncbi:MAG: acetyl-CoA carboxylase carboxyl transferase subunit beta [Ignavibacteria bacterium]|nr:acetyl-CoA carboxylase carboxyl transferase subunit beta [Ignavibacteria bacterium]
MVWFSKSKSSNEIVELIEMPDGLWAKCPSCNETIYKKELELNLFTCFKCNHHFKISVNEYIGLIIDENTFKEFNINLKAVDAINFIDSKPYIERIKEAKNKSEFENSIICGTGDIFSHKVVFGIINSSFLEGSLGSLETEKIYRSVRFSIENRIPFVLLYSSSENRIQESAISLMQIAKLTSIFNELKNEGIICVSILTEPTVGETAFALAVQGDIIIAEPGSTLGLSSKSNLEQKSKKRISDKFPKSDYYFNSGQIDLIVDRKKLKSTISNIIDWYNK